MDNSDLWTIIYKIRTLGRQQEDLIRNLADEIPEDGLMSNPEIPGSENLLEAICEYITTGENEKSLKAYIKAHFRRRDEIEGEAAAETISPTIPQNAFGATKDEPAKDDAEEELEEFNEFENAFEFADSSAAVDVDDEDIPSDAFDKQDESDITGNDEDKVTEEPEVKKDLSQKLSEKQKSVEEQFKDAIKEKENEPPESTDFVFPETIGLPDFEESADATMEKILSSESSQEDKKEAETPAKPTDKVSESKSKPQNEQPKSNNFQPKKKKYNNKPYYNNYRKQPKSEKGNNNEPK